MSAYNIPKIPYISLCTGYEGIGTGLERVIPNLRAVAYCEREAFAISNLVAKVENGLLAPAPIYTDVATFPFREFYPVMGSGIVSAGFPCQPVSCAGKRKATEDERWLFDILCDGFNLMRPGVIFLENVDGLLSAKMPDETLVIAHIVTRLEEMDYHVEVGVFSAAEVGAPHQRKRCFILAYDPQQQNFCGVRRIMEEATGEGGCSDPAFGSSSADELPNAFGEGSGEVPDRRRFSSVEGSCSDGSEGGTIWPSRPGQPQWGWEPARVVADARSKQFGPRTPRDLEHDTIQSTQCDDGCGDITAGAYGCQEEVVGETEQHDRRNAYRETQSPLGRDADGSTPRLDLAELSGLSHEELAEIYRWMEQTDNRVDELRLLGNGVVPATAERAWRVLWGRVLGNASGVEHR